MLIGEPKTQNFFDSGIFEPVTKPQNQLFLFLETPGHLKRIKKNQTVNKHIFYKSRNFATPQFRQFPKRRAPKNDADPFKQSSEILDMGPISKK